MRHPIPPQILLHNSKLICKFEPATVYASSGRWARYRDDFAKSFSHDIVDKIRSSWLGALTTSVKVRKSQPPSSFHFLFFSVSFSLYFESVYTYMHTKEKTIALTGETTSCSNRTFKLTFDSPVIKLTDVFVCFRRSCRHHYRRSTSLGCRI